MGRTERNLSASLAGALLGKTRRAVLSLFFMHVGESFYQDQVVVAVGSGHGAVQRELRRLTDAGILARSVSGRQVYFRANEECPIFADLRGLIVKTAGLADVIRTALAPLRDRIVAAFIFGSMARGEEKPASDVDLLVVGDVGMAGLVSSLSEAQRTLAREINPTIYPPNEFSRKMREGQHFIRSVMADPKLFLIGDDGELERLAQGRLARGAQHKPAGGGRSAGRGRSRPARLPESRPQL